MMYIILSALWLVFALVLGFAISYSDRTNKLAQIGIGFIFGSFGIGMAMLGYAIIQIL